MPDILMQRYETIVEDAPEGVRQIARHLGIDLDRREADAIARKYSLEANRRRMSAFEAALRKEGRDRGVADGAWLYDEHTLLHRNHITGGPGSAWRASLSLDELRLLKPVVGQWLIDAGYEQDMRWVDARVGASI
jgi:hypothetical protein